MTFGFSLSGNASKSKTTTNSVTNSSGTTTPIVPKWGEDVVRRGAERVNSLFDQSAQARVAPSNPLLDQAAKAGGGLPTGGGADTAWLKPFMEADTPFTSGGKAHNYIDAYLNPYLKEVVDSSAADLDANAGQVRAQQALELAGSGAFGGSGAALARSLTEGELLRGRASTLSGLRSRAFETALGAAAGDADRATQARISNAQLKLQDQGQKAGFGFQAQQATLAGNADARANIAAQAELGGTLRGIDAEQRNAEATNASQIVAMLSGLPINLFTGQSQQQTQTFDETKKGKEVGVSAGVKADFP